MAVAALAVLASTSAACSSLADDRERETTCAEAPRAFIRQAWALSGSVDDVAVHCDTIYVAGDGTIGQRTGPLALVSNETGRRVQALPSLSGDFGDATEAEPLAQAIVEDGQGGWFVGGAFGSPTSDDAQVSSASCDRVVWIRRFVHTRTASFASLRGTGARCISLARLRTWRGAEARPRGRIGVWPRLVVGAPARSGADVSGSRRAGSPCRRSQRTRCIGCGRLHRGVLRRCRGSSATGACGRGSDLR